MRWTLVIAGVVLSFPCFAAGQWVEFVNETAARLMCGDSEGGNCSAATLQNNDEKTFAWGDVDGDTDLDLVSVTKPIGSMAEPKRNYLFLNENGVLVDRTTEFASLSTVTLQDETLSLGFLDLTTDMDVVLADVNGDDWLDIVTAPTLGSEFGKAISHPRVYINLADDPPGSGNWQGFIFDDEDRAPTMDFEPRFPTVTAADIDDDGDLDLYFGDNELPGPYERHGDLNNRLWINDGTGYFDDQSTLRMTDAQREVYYCRQAHLHDMNGDDYIDVVIANSPIENNAISIVYNDPETPGFFQEMPRDFVYEQNPYYVSVGDLNNDLAPDLVITDLRSDRYMLNERNNEAGLAQFGPYLTLVGATSGVFGGNNHIADLDNDGWNDVLVTSADTELPSCSAESQIYRNLADAPEVTIEDQGTLGIAEQDLEGVFDMAPFDIDGDAWKDLVIGNCDGMQVYVHQPPCPGDINTDYVIGIQDLLELLAAWGSCPDCAECPAELDGDCIVSITDLLALLANWGACS